MAKNNAIEKLVKLGEYEAEPMVQGLGGRCLVMIKWLHYASCQCSMN